MLKWNRFSFWRWEDRIAEKKLTVSQYFTEIIEGRVSFSIMIPTAKIVASDSSGEEDNMLTDEEIRIKGEESLVQMKQLIKRAKLSKVTKANLKQYLQHINSYVNK